MRAFVRALLTASIIVILAACSTSSGSVSPPVPTPGPVQRGHVQKIFQVGVLTKSRMLRNRGLQVIAQLGGYPECDVTVYSILYTTAGVNGEAADTSAGLYVPGKGCKGPFPVVGYAHGTTVVKSESMTHPPSLDAPHTYENPEAIYVAAIYAAHGYVVVATDYLGEGLSSYSFQPYVNVQFQANAVVDALRAAKTAARGMHLALSGRIFLNGYSQGGHATLGTQKVIETQTGGEFDLRGVAPDSGMYALDEWIVEAVDNGLNHKKNVSSLLAYVFPSYERVYGNIYNDPSDVFQAPYDKIVDDLMPVRTPRQAYYLYHGTLPSRLSRFLVSSWASDFLTNEQNPARQDLYANNLLHGWNAKAPLYFCGGKRDPVVDFQNTVEAKAYFAKHGTSVKVLDVDSQIPTTLPKKIYHDAALVFCEPETRVNFFDKLK